MRVTCVTIDCVTMSQSKRTILLKTTDFDSNKVILTNDTWGDKLMHPIFGHPEIKPYFNKIESVISDPDVVFESFRDPRSRLFYKFNLGRGKLLDCYMVVVVKYIQENFEEVGYVSTAMFNKLLPKKGNILWQK